MKKRGKGKSGFEWLKVLFISSVGVLLIISVIVIFQKKFEDRNKGITDIIKEMIVKDKDEVKPEVYVRDLFLDSSAITQDYLTPNEYSRPGDKLEKVNAIVVHYVGNPGTTAAQNRNYFENLKDTHYTSASSHYIIGLDGEIIQCIPLDEISYASNNRNIDTIAIECCHPDASGEFTQATYNSLVLLTTALCKTYKLDTESGVIRHYDVTGKHCPLYYVENENAWLNFKLDIMKGLNAE